MKTISNFNSGDFIDYGVHKLFYSRGGTEETSSNTNEELIQFSGTEDLSKDEKSILTM